MGKIKTLVLDSDTNDDILWYLKQEVTENGKVYGTGHFVLKNREEWNKSVRDYRKGNIKALVLYSGVEGGFYWRVTQSINRNGKMLRTGSINFVGDIERNRHSVLGSSGKVFRNLEKRKRPEICEICNDPVKRLHYHHWDDKKPNNGIWCCVRCHFLIEYYEKIKIKENKDKIIRYEYLKKSIEEKK